MRARVRGDYEARLRGVIDELRGHAATIAAELDRHKAAQGSLDLERRSAEEALAEAEVRHAVGEYSEGEWKKLSDESNERLTRLRSELRLVGDEIARLAEVQGLIGGAPKPVEPPPAPAPPPPAPAPSTPVALVPDPDPEPEPEHQPYAPPPPPPASRPTPRAAPPREPEITHGPPPVDELAFLKSVAPAEERKPAPAAARRAQQSGIGGDCGRPRLGRAYRDEPDDGTGEGGRRGRRQDPQVRRMRHPQPADGVVLRALRSRASRDLIGFGK